MTGSHISIEVKGKSTEGMHDLIVLLEKVVDALKGGSEKGRVECGNGSTESITGEALFKVQTHV